MDRVTLHPTYRVAIQTISTYQRQASRLSAHLENSLQLYLANLGLTKVLFHQEHGLAL